MKIYKIANGLKPSHSEVEPLRDEQLQDLFQRFTQRLAEANHHLWKEVVADWRRGCGHRDGGQVAGSSGAMP